MDVQRKLEGLLFLRACPESARVFSGVRSEPSSLICVWSCFPYVVNQCAMCAGPKRPTFPASHFYQAPRGGRSQSSCLSLRRNVLCISILELGMSQGLPLLFVSRRFSREPLFRRCRALGLRCLALRRGPCQEPTLSPQVGGSVPAPILPSAACASMPFCPHGPGTHIPFCVFLFLCFLMGTMPVTPVAGQPGP